MPALTIQLLDTAPHNVFNMISGFDTSGNYVIGSGTTPGLGFSPKHFLGTGFDITLTAWSSNAGKILTGDGTLSTVNYGSSLAAGQNKMYEGKTSMTGLWVEATDNNDRINVEWSIGIG